MIRRKEAVEEEDAFHVRSIGLCHATLAVTRKANERDPLTAKGASVLRAIVDGQKEIRCKIRRLNSNGELKSLTSRSDLR